VSNDNPNAPPTRATILVADDTKMMRRTCQRVLEKAGHRVVLAEDGDQALAVAADEPVDVALLDVKMPGPSGLDVMEAIKRDNDLVEVLIMTAYATEDIAREALRLGASDFLTKPFDSYAVLAVAAWLPWRSWCPRQRWPT